MSKVLVSVEGQTEETFIREVLSRHLAGYGVHLIPVVLSTKRVKQGLKFKGGLVSYDQARGELVRLLRDSSAAAVTTMYDYYALPGAFPGSEFRRLGHGPACVAQVEAAFQQDFGDPHFHPYLQLHEFETFLFVDPQLTAETLLLTTDDLRDLEDTCRQFGSPENIDDGPRTAPSKRILALYPQYEKPLYGALVAAGLGVERLKKSCPHFGVWVAWLESLGAAE